MDKRGQVNPGLITGLVFGIASLVIGVIIAFVIISTMTGADLLTSGRTTTSVTNETPSWVNQTSYTVTGASTAGIVSFSLTEIWSGAQGKYNVSIPLTNASITSTGIVRNATVAEYGNTSLSYSYVIKSIEESTTDRLSANFTKGIDNVSEKIPTVLLVAAIVLILGVLAVLVGVWQRMRMGQGGL